MPRVPDPDTKIPAGFTRDPDYWYRRWLFALEMLDEAGTQIMQLAHELEKDAKYE